MMTSTFTDLRDTRHVERCSYVSYQNATITFLELQEIGILLYRDQDA